MEERGEEAAAAVVARKARWVSAQCGDRSPVSCGSPLHQVPVVATLLLLFVPDCVACVRYQTAALAAKSTTLATAALQV